MFNGMRSDNHLKSFEFQGHLLLLHPDRSSLLVLNPTARLIWNAIGGGMTPAEAARLLADSFGLGLASAAADVDTAIEQWRASGLLATPAPRHDHATTPERAAPPAPPPGRFEGSRIYALCGRPIRLRFETESLRALVEPLLAPAETADVAFAETIDLYGDGAATVIAVDGRETERAADTEEAIGMLISRILDLSYPEARWLAVIHAGAVADERGAVLLPAASGSGKSTLTAGLVHAGLRYLSDDAAALDGRTERLVPVPFAACLKQGSWPVLAARFPALTELPIYATNGTRRRYLDLSRRSPRPPVAGLPVQAIVFPRYGRKRPPAARPLSPLAALEHLLVARCWLSLDTDDVSATLEWISRTPAFVVNYSSLDEGIRIVFEALEQAQGGQPQRSSQRA